MVISVPVNDNEEPIVCTPREAVRGHARTDMEALARGPFWTAKAADGPGGEAA